MKFLRAAAILALSALSADVSAQFSNYFGSLLTNQVTAPPPGGRYFFVQTAGTWNGNLGGLSGANAKCLADLAANDWKGKSEATLNSTTVKAFLCDGTTCQNSQPSTGYVFAKSGDTNAGGASFWSNASGLGPGMIWGIYEDAGNWTTLQTFNSTSDYWTGRFMSGAMDEWPNTSYTTRCSAWGSTSGNGSSGTPAGFAYQLWIAAAPACTTTLPLLCMVTQAGTDDDPDPISITPTTGAFMSTFYESSTVVTGFTGTLIAATMSDDGTTRLLRKNNTGTWGANVTVSPGDTLNARMRSSATSEAVKMMEITVGRQQTVYMIINGDWEPDAFDFGDVGNATPSTLYQSSAVLTGFDGPLTGSVSGGGAQIRVNNTGSWVTSLTISPGDTVNIRMTSSAAAAGSVTTTFSIGSVTSQWSITGPRPNIFVRTSTMYDGNLGGMAGADQKCLDDLTANKFQGKAGVPVNSTTVKAFLCDDTSCRNLNSNATYYFAVAGDATIGGASFTTNAMAIGPNNASYWNTATTFGGSADLWTGRLQQDANNWSSNPSGAACTNWTGNGSFTSGTFGYADYNDASRFNVSNLFACPTTRYFICSVTTTPIDSQPDVFTFTNTEGATPSTLYETSAVVTGFTAGLTFSATGGAEVRVNSTGSWATSVAANPGDTLNLRMTSPATVGGSITTTVTGGMRSATWTVMNLRRNVLVLTKSVWNGNLGGLSGANAKCLSDLTTYNYQGKTGATLDATTVKALLCDTTTCQNPNASTTYYYAVADSLADGGGTTAINASSQGPGDSTAWSNAARFGTTQNAFWSGRNTGAATLWSTTPGGMLTCTDWTNSTSGVTGRRGNLTVTTAARWSSTDIACNLTRPLICIVTSP